MARTGRCEGDDHHQPARAIPQTNALVDHLATWDDAAIVNVTSGLAFVPLVSTPTYSATKAALYSYTVSLREALKGQVEVIELAPPAVATSPTTGQENSAGHRPLEECADGVMALFATRPTPREVLVERVGMLRLAEVSSTFYQVLAQASQLSANSCG